MTLLRKLLMLGRSSERAMAASATGSGLGKNVDAFDGVRATGEYTAVCLDEHGDVRWADSFGNLVTTVGKNDLLDKYLGASGYTATWYVGLIGATSYTTGPNVADTAASHGGWAEATGYSQGARVTAAFAAASGGSKALSSAAQFSINADATIKGCFLINNSTKGGTTGILYSAGLFTAGDKTVQIGDTLNVSYTGSA